MNNMTITREIENEGGMTVYVVNVLICDYNSAVAGDIEDVRSRVLGVYTSKSRAEMVMEQHNKLSNRDLRHSETAEVTEHIVYEEKQTDTPMRKSHKKS